MKRLVLLALAFVAGYLARPAPEEPPVPRVDKRNLVATRAVDRIARLERSHERLLVDIETLRGWLRESERERQLLESLAATAKADQPRPDARATEAAVEPLLRRAFELLQAGDTAGAIPLLRAALALDPPAKLVESLLGEAEERALINLIASGRGTTKPAKATMDYTWVNYRLFASPPG